MAGPTAFMFGNEGTGMTEKQLRLCDSLVYIPQFGYGTASLNVSNAGNMRASRILRSQNTEGFNGVRGLMVCMCARTGKRARKKRARKEDTTRDGARE